MTLRAVDTETSFVAPLAQVGHKLPDPPPLIDFVTKLIVVTKKKYWILQSTRKKASHYVSSLWAQGDVKQDMSDF